LDTEPQDLDTAAVLKERPVFHSSLHLFIGGLVKTWPLNSLEGPDRTQAAHYILDTLFRTHPFTNSEKPGDTKETFVLRHDDLNFQNIFCDPETGEVTGIIDWERAFAAPRCIGYCSLPICLTPDWFEEYALLRGPHTPWSLDSYRKIYANAMIEATGSDGDDKYTEKSAIYQAAFGAVYPGCAGGSVEDFAKKLLRQIPSLAHMDEDTF
jgi:hypothetical protein